MTAGRDSVNEAEASSPGEEEANTNPQEQEEFERAMEELSNTLYTDDATSESLVSMIQPDNKVDTTTKAIITLITSMDDKINIDETVFYRLTQETADRVIDLAEAAGTEFSEREIEQIAVASWEGIMAAYGEEETLQEDYDLLSQGVSETDMEQAKVKYEDLKRG